jgi:hypothetical protein
MGISGPFSNLALIVRSRNAVLISLVAPVALAALGSALAASAQDLSRRPSTSEAAFLKENDAAMSL